MICRVFVHAFTTAVSITTLHGQCSSDLVQVDVVLHGLAIETNMTCRAFDSSTFNSDYLFYAVLASGMATAQTNRFQHCEETQHKRNTQIL